jgi:hypothetical protein
MPDGEPVPAEGNLASFLLAIGGVSIAFWAAFVFTFDGVVLQLLAIVVGVVAAFSLTVALVLDSLGYFDAESGETDVATGDPADAGITVEAAGNGTVPKSDKPLPPIINFDTELRALTEAFDDEPPTELADFREEYARLKEEVGNRKTIASSMRSGLNGLSVRVEQSDNDEALGITEDIGERLFRYIKASPAENVELIDVGLFVDGERVTVEGAQGETARIKTTIRNGGEEGKFEVAVRFENRNGITVREETLPAGRVTTNAQKTLDTRVYVPSLATGMEVRIVEAPEEREVLDL